MYTNAADGNARFEDYVVTDLPADVVAEVPDGQLAVRPRHRGTVDGRLRRAEDRAEAAGGVSVAGAFSGAFEVTR